MDDDNNVVLTKATIISKPFIDDTLYRINNQDDLTSGIGSSTNSVESSKNNLRLDYPVKNKKNYKITSKTKNKESSSSGSNKKSVTTITTHEYYNDNKKKNSKTDEKPTNNNIIIDVNKLNNLVYDSERTKIETTKNIDPIPLLKQTNYSSSSNSSDEPDSSTKSNTLDSSTMNQSYSTILLTPNENHNYLNCETNPNGTYSFQINNKYENNDQKFNNEKVSNIPKQVVLSWVSLTIKAEVRNITDRFLSACKITKKKKRFETILHKVRGIVEPGELLALMGPSGSGKTTLLNALNFSARGSLHVDGRIMINGCQVDATRMAMISSYIQQDDLFFGTLTVKEHLIFHAMLRMDKSISKETKLRRVYQVLREFNLESRANVKIGVPGRIKGISGGEKRRLAFASEILTDPALLFCDEPTSGLDSYMAKSIIYYLKKMANAGKTIVCTIHQPSSETFAIFDKICILSQTRVAYFGSREDGLKFFTNNLNKICPPFCNPSDFYMDTLGVDVNDSGNSAAQIHNYCEIYENSQFNKELVDKIENVKPQYFSIPSNYTPYKSRWFDQMTYLLQRSFYNYFRNHKVVFNDFIMVLVTALLGGLIYYKTSENVNGTCTFDQRAAENISFALFYTITVTVIVSMLSAVMAFPLEIPIYYREHASFVYRSDTYYLAKLLSEFPIYLILPAIHATVIYFMVGYGCNGTHFAVFLFSDILIANAAFSLGHILSIISHDVNMAVSLSAPVITIQMLFSGFFLKKALNTPQFLTYIKYVSIFNYGFDLLMINQWENITELKCEYDLELLCLQSGPSLLKESKIDPDNKLLCVCLLMALAVSFRIISFVILWIKGLRAQFSFQRVIKKFKSKVIVKN